MVATEVAAGALAPESCPPASCTGLLPKAVATSKIPPSTMVGPVNALIPASVKVSPPSFARPRSPVPPPASVRVPVKVLPVVSFPTPSQTDVPAAEFSTVPAARKRVHFVVKAVHVEDRAVINLHVGRRAEGVFGPGRQRAVSISAHIPRSVHQDTGHFSSRSRISAVPVEASPRPRGSHAYRRGLAAGGLQGCAEAAQARRPSPTCPGGKALADRTVARDSPGRRLPSGNN